MPVSNVFIYDIAIFADTALKMPVVYVGVKKFML